MPPYIITPWRIQADLLAVRQQLYLLDGADNRRYAVDRVMAWRLRGNLPHAVESTALLIDAFLHHDITANSSFSIRAVYSAAFCRFVTGFCDIGRNRERSLEPSSMLEIARQIDMPADFVTLRHEATHEELPAEQRIVAACEAALQWLWKVYWSRLDSARPERDYSATTDDIERSDACKAFAQKMFRTYRSAKRDSLKKKESPKLLQQRLAESIDAFAELCADEAEVLQAVVDDIIEKGLLIPTDRVPASSLDGAFLLWDDLLQNICQAQQPFMAALARALLAAISGEDCRYQDIQQEAYALWLSHICSSVEWEELFGKQLIDIRRSVMKYCVAYPNVRTVAVMEACLFAGNDSFAEEWKHFFDAAKLEDDEDQATDHDDESPAELRPSEGMIVESEARLLAGWHRTVLPPVTPLGVVA